MTKRRATNYPLARVREQYYPDPTSTSFVQVNEEDGKDNLTLRSPYKKPRRPDSLDSGLAIYDRSVISPTSTDTHDLQGRSIQLPFSPHLHALSESSRDDQPTENASRPQPSSPIFRTHGSRSVSPLSLWSPRSGNRINIDMENSNEHEVYKAGCTNPVLKPDSEKGLAGIFPSSSPSEQIPACPPFTMSSSIRQGSVNGIEDPFNSRPLHMTMPDSKSRYNRFGTRTVSGGNATTRQTEYGKSPIPHHATSSNTSLQSDHSRTRGDQSTFISEAGNLTLDNDAYIESLQKELNIAQQTVIDLKQSHAHQMEKKDQETQLRTQIYHESILKKDNEIVELKIKLRQLERQLSNLTGGDQISATLATDQGTAPRSMGGVSNRFATLTRRVKVTPLNNASGRVSGPQQTSQRLTEFCEPTRVSDALPRHPTPRIDNEQDIEAGLRLHLEDVGESEEEEVEWALCNMEDIDDIVSAYQEDLEYLQIRKAFGDQCREKDDCIGEWSEEGLIDDNEIEVILAWAKEEEEEDLPIEMVEWLTEEEDQFNDRVEMYQDEFQNPFADHWKGYFGLVADPEALRDAMEREEGEMVLFEGHWIRYTTGPESDGGMVWEDDREFGVIDDGYYW
ncbi:hypothetical protein I204_02233 [Kwoniella mangroviensis CBS 8886]|uniref:hypothetical protein n=1 Tax=Kwoniella mangroviensis CBS 8507 TaxID=1296122 RepID=UPI00080D50CA|nr:uncharacterized protein I203_02398 [Kwoniella mangroviensis CBS 8507]OCF69003.1 hypothetical protein I203_02398 [Kwoniella mangroviensis CBS 8507]OCF76536.1 hypothetical protein I204_02233 [Kwoniella mangroviensis CBS 8886]